METIKDKAFGIIPIIYEDGRPKTLIVKHKRDGFWGYPKGHKDHEEESDLEAATRELKEETSLEVLKVYKQEPFIENYSFQADEKIIEKTVVFFLAQTTTKTSHCQNELLDLKWVDLEDLENMLTYEEAKVIARELKNLF